MKRAGETTTSGGLILGGLYLLYLISLASAWATSPLAVTLASFTGRVEGNTVVTEGASLAQVAAPDDDADEPAASSGKAPVAMNTAAATPTRFQPTALPESNSDGGNAAPAGSNGEPPAVAQATETPDAYPDAEDEAPPLVTVAPGGPTPTPEGGYPAGDNMEGTGRVGGDRAIFGTAPSNDEAAAPDDAAQTEQKGLGGFILWLGFLFGLIVFIAGILFSVVFSTRDRRTNP